ncbi:MAG TPA: S9 family peptidase, partial [Mycobacterium sp.]|nr:S9 family peptidase [Mycobacterium sp.]
MAAGYLCIRSGDRGSGWTSVYVGVVPSPDTPPCRIESMGSQVRRVYGASMSPDATAFAHLVDDGGFPRAVQRFLRGWRASSSRDVELPVEGAVTRVLHSADGH